MNDRSNYAINGVYRCENFAQYVETNNFPSFLIGTVAGIDDWYITFKKYDDATVVCPFLACNDKPDLLYRVYLNVIKEDGSSEYSKERNYIVHEYSYLTYDYGRAGFKMNIDELLNEENGYLVHGAILIEYGIHVDAILGDDEIWHFNFYDRFFEKKQKMSVFLSSSNYATLLYCHSQFMFAEYPACFPRKVLWVSRKIKPSSLEMCLQIAHGVRIQLTANQSYKMVKIAIKFGLLNAVKYCERQLIEMNEQINLEAEHFKLAVRFKMDRYLNHLVQRIISVEQMVGILKELDIERMSTESMKSFVAKLLSI
ncbi:unnamed protein product [Caenorhabditis brenneri]